MPTQWTAEQILALAPDAASAKNGRGLATARKWISLGQSPETPPTVVWGECQGSGKTPYRTQIDLGEPAFRCSCPSRKFPCKHGLGLFLLLAEHPQDFAAADPPDWVTEWLNSRAKRAEKQAEKQAEKPARQKAATADPQAQAKRAEARQQKVNAGVQDLRLWLEDQVRQGMVAFQQQSYGFWDTVAARMVDAQAPGLARRVRELASTVLTGTGWNDRTLAKMGQLYLLLEGCDRMATLPPAVQADLRTQIGWTMSQEEVLAEPAQGDLWWVAGQHTQVEDRLRARRTWLLGLGSGTPALVLEFAYGQQSFETNLLPGMGMEAELAFYPSAYPLRAVIKTCQEAVPLAQPPPVQGDIETAIAAYGRAFAACPWVEQFPLLLPEVVPLRDGVRWWVQDGQGRMLPLGDRPGFYALDAASPVAHAVANAGASQPASYPPAHPYWQLLALSGVHPVTLFGEWDGTALFPLSVWAEEGFYGLGN